MVLSGEPVSFGRKSDNSVVIVSPSASRLHAEILTEDAGFVLYDRESRNGTFVNDQRVTRHVLRPNDSIRIGDETFLYEAQDAMETVMDLSLMDVPRPSAADPERCGSPSPAAARWASPSPWRSTRCCPGGPPSRSTTGAGPGRAPRSSGRTRPRGTSAASRW
ncbi:FHA domain-containing protein [Streptomyces sp. MS1.HAVA.3]|uniref:FHA domain-containing protein n=1 Tax=Streptomyces caledonius TaxID=3134107 RepID=A0ABU8U2R1_9ACTN